MNKLDVVKFLIEEIEHEQTLPGIIAADRKQAKEIVEELKKDEHYTDNWYYGNYLRYNGRNYNKKRIKDNCKKIRQILSDVSKEVK